MATAPAGNAAFYGAAHDVGAGRVALALVPARGDWYALPTRASAEFTARAWLLRHDIECFLPSWTRLSLWRDRRVPIERPLFPGYVFAHFHRSRLNEVRHARGLSSILGPGNKPLAIDAEIIEQLKRAARDPRAVIPAARPLAQGDRVTVASGPLAGLTGTVERTKNARRLILSIDIIGRACAVELGAAEVFKAQ